MKIPHIIERWIARYSDGEIEDAQKKLMDDWVHNSPELQQEIKDQQAVSSHVKQTFSNQKMRTQMEKKLNQTLSSLPSQTKPNQKSWLLVDVITTLSSIQLVKIPHISSRTLGTVAVVMFLGIIALINGPVTPPNVAFNSYQSQSDEKRSGSVTNEERNYFSYGDQVSSKVYSESTDSRGLSGPPGVVSNTQDDGFGSERRFRYSEDSRLSLGRTNYAEQMQSLGYTSSGLKSDYGMGMGGMGGRVDDDGDGVQDRFFSEFDSFESNQVSRSINGVLPVNEQAIEGKLIAQGVTSNSNIIDPNADTSSQSLEPDEPDATEGRKIIRNARMSLQVQDVLATKDRIEEMIKTVRGLISNANINQDSSVPSARLTLWVPADVLEQVIEELNTYGKALNLEIFTNDITEQYFDMESRVRNLKIQEERLLDLYEREVKKLDEILQVEKEVQRVRTEIEQLEGRKRLWDRQVSLSTIEIAIIQEPEKKPIVQNEPDSVFSPIRRVWRDAGAVFLYSCSIMTGMVASVLSTVIFFFPWMVVLTLIGFAGRIIWKRR